ncbi:MAG: transporter substrate-binding domain-containing protein [Ignavibacteriales bacterium]|nr:transporter substrate-binding domain-containing protein [Ignavibacteriales bacterium]
MKKLKLIFTLLMIILLLSCSEKEEIPDIDLEQIREKGKLVALTGYNAYSYFIYRGQPMGYEYELIKKFADHLGLELEITVVRDIDKMFEMLNAGEGDIIAYNLTVTLDRKEKVEFAHHHNLTNQVLVQRKPDNWQKLSKEQLADSLITNVVDLINDTIYVEKGSSYIERLNNLQEEIGGTFHIVEVEPEVSTEDLIEMVSVGKINCTVADENIALLYQGYYSNIDIQTEISLPQKIAWAVRKNSPKLLKELNRWIEDMRRKPEYATIYKKYFLSQSSIQRRMESEFLSIKGGKISRYDDLIKEHSKKINWDWRLVASVVYQESQFHPSAQSWAGARGLMQLMPAVVEQYNVTDPYDPYQSINAGTKYLNWLNKYWSDYIKDEEERIKFVLASYNCGFGHIIDARNLAEKYGSDPNVWFKNVEVWLLNKSKSKYYRDVVVRYGYCRGIETVNYVPDVLNRFDHYKKLIKS